MPIINYVCQNLICSLNLSVLTATPSSIYLRINSECCKLKTEKRACPFFASDLLNSKLNVCFFLFYPAFMYSQLICLRLRWSKTPCIWTGPQGRGDMAALCLEKAQNRLGLVSQSRANTTSTPPRVQGTFCTFPLQGTDPLLLAGLCGEVEPTLTVVMSIKK